MHDIEKKGGVEVMIISTYPCDDINYWNDNLDKRALLHIYTTNGTKFLSCISRSIAGYIMSMDYIWISRLMFLTNKL